MEISTRKSIVYVDENGAFLVTAVGNAIKMERRHIVHGHHVVNLFNGDYITKNCIFAHAYVYIQFL